MQLLVHLVKVVLVLVIPAAAAAAAGMVAVVLFMAVEPVALVMYMMKHHRIV